MRHVTPLNRKKARGGFRTLTPTYKFPKTLLKPRNQKLTSPTSASSHRVEFLQSTNGCHYPSYTFASTTPAGWDSGSSTSHSPQSLGGTPCRSLGRSDRMRTGDCSIAYGFRGFSPTAAAAPPFRGAANDWQSQDEVVSLTASLPT
jgi:hypothetical protein